MVRKRRSRGGWRTRGAQGKPIPFSHRHIALQGVRQRLLCQLAITRTHLMAVRPISFRPSLRNLKGVVTAISNCWAKPLGGAPRRPHPTDSTGWGRLQPRLESRRCSLAPRNSRRHRWACRGPRPKDSKSCLGRTRWSIGRDRACLLHKSRCKRCCPRRVDRHRRTTVGRRRWCTNRSSNAPPPNRSVFPWRRRPGLFVRCPSRSRGTWHIRARRTPPVAEQDMPHRRRSPTSPRPRPDRRHSSEPRLQSCSRRHCCSGERRRVGRPPRHPYKPRLRPRRHRHVRSCHRRRERRRSPACRPSLSPWSRRRRCRCHQDQSSPRCRGCRPSQLARPIHRPRCRPRPQRCHQDQSHPRSRGCRPSRIVRLSRRPRCQPSRPCRPNSHRRHGSLPSRMHKPEQRSHRWSALSRTARLSWPGLVSNLRATRRSFWRLARTRQWPSTGSEN
jgi:hypothetical protein